MRKGRMGRPILEDGSGGGRPSRPGLVHPSFIVGSCKLPPPETGYRKELAPMKKSIALTMALALAVILAAPLVAQDSKPTTAPETEKKDESKMHRTPSGLQYEDTKVGTGATPQKGQTCVMHYTGWLWENNAKGKKFDSSVDRGTPFQFKLGQGQVIRGWDEGIATMK